MTGEPQGARAERAAAGAALPIAPTQEMQWELMAALWPDDPGASRVLIVDNQALEGPLDPAVARAALTAVTARHDALRLVFDTVGVDPTVRVERTLDAPVELLDVSGLSEAEQRARVDAVVFGENRRRFDLRAGPLWHAWLIRLGPERHLLTTCFSHLVADGASCGVFVRDFMTAYAACLAGTAGWPDTLPSFAGMRALQAERFRELPGGAGHWHARLAPAPRAPRFVRRAGPDADLLARAGIALPLEPATVAGVRKAAWRARTTPFVVLLAAYHVLLSLLTGKERTVVASGTAARPTAGERNAVMQLVTDALVSTPTPPGASLLEVVAATHEAMTAAVEHLAPFKAVARAVNPAFEQQRPWPDYKLCDGHFYSAAAAPGGGGVDAGGLRATPAYRPGAAPAGFRSDLTVGDLPGELHEAWEAWCGPSVAVGTERDRVMFIFNDQVYPAAWMRAVADAYRWLVDTLATAGGTDVGTLRRQHARRFAPRLDERARA